MWPCGHVAILMYVDSEVTPRSAFRCMASGYRAGRKDWTTAALTAAASSLDGLWNKCHQVSWWTGGQPNCVGMFISRQSWAECCTLIAHDIHGAGKHHSTPIAPVASFSHLVVRSRELSSPGLTTCTAVGPHQALHLLSVSRLRSNLQQTYHFYIFLFIFEGNSTKSCHLPAGALPLKQRKYPQWVHWNLKPPRSTTSELREMGEILSLTPAATPAAAPEARRASGFWFILRPTTVCDEVMQWKEDVWTDWIAQIAANIYTG